MAAWGCSARQLPAPGSQHPVHPTLGVDSQLLPPLQKYCHCWGEKRGSLNSSQIPAGSRSRSLICLCMVLHAYIPWLQLHALMLSCVGRVAQGAGCLRASQGNAGGLPPQIPAQRCPQQPATLGTDCQPHCRLATAMCCSWGHPNASTWRKVSPLKTVAFPVSTHWLLYPLPTLTVSKGGGSIIAGTWKATCT